MSFVLGEPTGIRPVIWFCSSRMPALARPAEPNISHPIFPRFDPMDLSIVIPVKNEAENIAPLVNEVRTALDGVMEYEILYVDDGSGDGTAAEILRLADEMPQLRLVRHAQSCGQSAAIRTGVRSARAPWVATIDGDGQNDPADILRLWHLCRAASATQPLLIIGYRKRRQDSWSKRAASRIANTIRGGFLKDHTPDSGCGLRLFSRSLFLDLPYFDHMHRFLPALVLREGGLVRSVPVNHRPRRRGVSKYGVLDRFGVGIIDLLGVRWLQRRATRPCVLYEVMIETNSSVSPSPAMSTAR
jgi:dolichol-phosphate mannosyltransferase